MDGPQSWPDPPQPTRLGEVPWLEPYPDLLLDELPGTESGPAARYEATEAISLAFITALQLLPPRQRAVLVLRDVLGFSTAEAAEMLQATPDSAASAFKRARATLARRSADAAGRQPPPAPDSLAERALVRHLTEAYATGDVNAVISLLTDDVWLTMPPAPFEYQGREVAGRALALLFGRGLRDRLVATRANGQPAFGLYVNDPRSGVLHANGLMVLTLAGERISALARFDNSSLARFGLPRTLDDADAVLITDQHADHFLPSLIAGRLAPRPRLPIWTNKDVAVLLEGSGATVHVIGDGDAFTMGGIRVQGHGEWHAPIHPDVTRVRNTGFLLEQRVFHPGDAYTDPHAPVDLLFVPEFGLYTRFGYAIDFIRQVKPKQASPVHDTGLDSTGLAGADSFLVQNQTPPFAPGTGSGHRARPPSPGSSTPAVIDGSREPTVADNGPVRQSGGACGS